MSERFVARPDTDEPQDRNDNGKRSGLNNPARLIVLVTGIYIFPGILRYGFEHLGVISRPLSNGLGVFIAFLAVSYIPPVRAGSKSSLMKFLLFGATGAALFAIFTAFFLDNTGKYISSIPLPLTCTLFFMIMLIVALLLQWHDPSQRKRLQICLILDVLLVVGLTLSVLFK